MGMLDAAEEKLGWRARRRNGIEITALQFMALSDLAVAKAAGTPFITLDMHPTSIKTMIDHDWIVASKSRFDDSVLYKITQRGEKVLNRFSQIPRRQDGLCPRCGERARRVRRTGEIGPYCGECERGITRRKKELGIKDSHSKPGLCPCGKRQKIVTSTGYVKSYCKVCTRRHRKQEKKRKDARLRARIEAGEKVLCSCGVGERTVQPSGRVTDLCRECRKKYMDGYNRRRRSA